MTAVIQELRPSLRLSPRAAGREGTEPRVVRMIPGLAWAIRSLFPAEIHVCVT